jgi:NAD+ synthase (glutamine-hydrolysing)
MRLKIAMGQMQVYPGDPLRNFKTIQAYYKEALAASADILVLPELCLSGYLIGDLFEDISYLKECQQLGIQLAELATTTTILFGNIALEPNLNGEDGRPLKFNAAFAANQGKFLTNPATGLDYFSKTLLPDYREFEESRHFSSNIELALRQNKSIDQVLSPVEIPLPDQSLIRVGITLCEDGWGDDYHLKPDQILAEKGAEIIFNLSSSPFTLGKNLKRNRLFSGRSAELKIPLVYLNNIGIQNNGKTLYAFDGDSTVYFPDQTIQTVGSAYQSKMKIITLDDPNKKEINLGREGSEAQAIFDLLDFGVGEFMQQSGLTRVVIGASGGIDSAVSAALFCKILGPENVLLVNMPSKHNSKTTLELARQLSENLGSWYAEVPIEASVELTRKQIQNLEIKRGGAQAQVRLSDFHFENVQARDRSARILAALASGFQGVYPSNANKAETMVGYATLCGDHSGFLAPLADLWKHQVYDLGRYLNEVVFKREVIPAMVFEIMPSAELNPAQTIGQGGDPLHYPYHDKLFEQWMQVWHRKGPEDILRWYLNNELEIHLGLDFKISSLFPDVHAFIADLERWWRLFKGMGVVKRVQAPPIVAVSRRAFGFDFRESILPVWFSQEYLKLKASCTG